MQTRLTTFSKILITALILGVIFFAFRYFLNTTDYGKKLKEKSAQQSAKTADSPGAVKSNDAKDDDVITVQMFTWGGYVPGLYFNEGAAASTNSRFYKDYGIKVEFKLIDDFDASRQAWKGGKVDLLGNEVSAMATEMEGLAPYEPQIVLQCDWSRGGDAIVAKRGINSFNDLKGKSVAVTPSTPSMTFLLWMLEAANLKITDIKMKEVPSAIDAATAFKSGQVDAAVVWSPDDEICVREVPGSKILQSTRQASNIIADVYMARKSWVDKNADKLAKFYEGWMKATAEINTSEASRTKAAKIFAQVTGLAEADAVASINNVRLTSHGDNLNFFGKNTEYKGITGEGLYTKMGNIYQSLKLAPANRPNWRVMAYGAAMGAATIASTGPGFGPEGQKAFPAPKEADKTAPELSSKPVSISFASGKYTLDENSKTLIDLQFAEVAKAFGNSRLRIEGNTDNVGSKALNKKLSLQRAESVAQYLQSQYGMARNRFVIVGNGPNKPVPGCETNSTDDCKSKNRRTEFQLIN